MRNTLYIFFIISLCLGSFSAYAENSPQKSCTKKVVKHTVVMASTGAVIGCLIPTALSVIPVMNLVAAPAAVTICSGTLGTVAAVAAVGATVGAADAFLSDECD